MAHHGVFCKDYMILKQEEAKFLDFFRILYSGELEKRDFFDSPVVDSVRGLRRRWLLLVSVFSQRLLFSLKTPMAAVGSALERWLNYPSSNGGYAQLLQNIVRGRVVRPDESSATYRTLIGHLDTRIELDRGIRNGDNRYNAALAIMAAKLSYENKAFVKSVIDDHWKMELLGEGFYDFWNEYQKAFSTHAIMFQDTTADPNLVVVAFRGTEPFDADMWRTDIDISWFELHGVGKVHAGFMKALGLQKEQSWPKEIETGPDQKPSAYYIIRDTLKEILSKNEKAKFILTGHSLGGALAILFPAVLTFHEEEFLLGRLEGVYTFGQPRVGDEIFGEYMKDKMKFYDVKYLRYVYCNDVVPRLPYDDKTLFFKHFGPCLYYNSCYRGKVLEEEPNKNYFSLLWVVPKLLNAAYEFIRSLWLPCVRGRDYHEGLSLIIFRTVGLVFPGLSAHGPEDYVNLTRIGSLTPSEEDSKRE